MDAKNVRYVTEIFTPHDIVSGKFNRACAEPALQNTARNGGHTIRSSTAGHKLRNASYSISFRLRNSNDPGLDSAEGWLSRAKEGDGRQ